MSIVFLYVDDLIFTGDLSVDKFKKAMKTEFEITDLGMMKYFLGIEVIQYEDGIFISQSNYANDVLRRFGMVHFKPVVTAIETHKEINKKNEKLSVHPTL